MTAAHAVDESTDSEELALPMATPAAADLVCWLWAAIPQRDGKINVTRAADALGVSRSTVRRWVTNAHDLVLNDTGTRILARRAILRGHGRYLWPLLDEATLARNEQQVSYARKAHAAILDRGPEGVPGWNDKGHLGPHTVAVVHYPKAHVYGVTSARTVKALQKVTRVGQIIQTRTVDSRFAAQLVKLETLARARDHRCVIPRELIPSGRTEVWLESAGPVRLMVPRLASTKITKSS